MECEIPHAPLLKRHWVLLPRTSFVQIITISICHLTSIGMWNALNGLGSLGTSDPRLSHMCNSTMYVTGIIGGLIGGVIVNVMGLKNSILLGVVGQSTAIASYFAYFYMHWISLPSVVVYSAITSIPISAMTTGIGTALVEYPSNSRERNRFIAVSSAILNVGGLSGAIVALCLNFGGTSASALSFSSYLCIVMISLGGILVGSQLSSPSQVLKSDGTTPTIMKSDFGGELQGMQEQLRNPLMYLLIPLWLVNVWHEVVVFNHFNSGLFNVRSRSANACVYYIARISGSFLFQKVCDIGRGTGGVLHSGLRVVRCCVVLISALLIIGSIVCVYILKSPYFTATNQLDVFTDQDAIIPIIVFYVYGNLETMSSSFTYLLLGLLPIGNQKQTSRIMGLSRMFINIGGSISWLIDFKYSTHTQWIINLTLWVAAMVGVLVASRSIKPDVRRKL